MNKSKAIRDYIAANPGVTNADLVKVVEGSRSYVASVTTTLFQSGQHTEHGVLRRELNGRTITNAPIYAYHFEQDNGLSVQDNDLSPAARKVPRRNAGTLDTLVESLASSIASTVADRVRERLVEEIKGLIPDPVSRPAADDFVARIKEAATKALPKPELPKILIVGLLPAQAGAISSEFAEVFDLRFWKDESQDKLKAAVRAADHVFLFVDKLGHSVEDTVRTLGTPFTRCPGGMTTLRQRLMEHFAKEQ